MSQKYCHQVGEWIEDNVSQQVQKCVEQDCDWWCACCNKWLCGLVWIIVTVTKWVVTTVCEILGDAFDLIVAIIIGVLDIIVGIFTWNWSLVWDGFMEIVGAAGGLLGDFIRAITLCGLIGGFRESINKWRLRGYVQDLIDKEERFSDKDRIQIKDALGINGGGFGLRLTVTSYRGFVRSDYIAPGHTVPALVSWNNSTDPNTKVDLKFLAGFKWNKFFERSRPDIRGDISSESDIDEYLSNPSSKSFSIYAMSDSALLDRIHAVQIKGDTIGLKLVVDLKDQLFTEPAQARASADPCNLLSLLASDPFKRQPAFPGTCCNHPYDPRDPNAEDNAKNELCTPVIVGTFLFNDNSYSGFSATLYSSTCLEEGKAKTCLDDNTIGNHGGTGAVYRHRLPDFATTYVAIHELGHTFGLCHVTGLDRIMVSNREAGWWWWSGWLLPEYLCFSGEPQFVYDEAKKVWDYIIANFPTDCLARRD
jgi:hypothetical protein